MPGSESPTVIPTRRRRVYESEDEDSGVSVSSSHSSKRARTLSPPGHERPEAHTPDDSWLLSPPISHNTSRDGPVLPDSYIVSPHRTGRTIQTSAVEASTPSEHKPGSILRIKLEHFVTYTNVEVFPGPALNMVIGPNGTGKSTLVCAICLGLGWGPQHLGRAKELSEFVKRGYNEATIEIELKGETGKSNPVIKRQIKREGNKSFWFLNGQASNLKSVLSVARSFSIQIDNLCQFLPQDRVAEFADLSPVELLASTQKAAAPEHMVEWYEELKRLRVEEKKEQTEESSKRNILASLENRQNLQRADVERLRQRTEVTKELELLEKTRPFAEYMEAKEKYEVLRAKKDAVKQEFNELKKEVAPTLAAMHHKDQYKDALERVVTQQKSNSEKAEKLAESQVRKMEGLEDKIRTCDVQRNSEITTGKEGRKIKARLEQDIANIKRAMSEAPIDFDPADYNARIRAKQAESRQFDDEIEERKQAGREKREEEDQKKERIKDAKRQLENLSSQAGQRENKLRTASADTAVAWAWIKENQDQFQQEIFGPALIECSVNDKRFVNMLESLLQRTDFLAFSCTNRADFKKLQEQLYGTMKLKDISIRVAGIPLDEFRPPVPDDVRRNLGLDGWAVDYITGPDTVLAMLCAEVRFNQTGIALSDTTPRQFEMLERSQVNSWATTKSTYQMTQRQEYGPSAKSTRVREVRPARFWTTQNVDVRLQTELKDNIEGWTSEAEELLKQARLIGSRIEEIKTQQRDVDEARRDLEDEKNQKQRALAEYNALPTKLAAQEAKLNEQVVREAKLRERLDALKDEENEHALAKAEVAIDHAQGVHTLRTIHVDLVQASIMAIEAQSDFETLKELNSTIHSRLEAKKKEVADVEEELKRVKISSRGAMDRARSARDDEEVMEYYNSLPEAAQRRFPADLDLEIEAMRARLDLLHAGNPGAVREFEERQRKIDDLQQRLAQLEATLATLASSISTLRAQWEPELDRLIAQISSTFSASFAKIRCAGQVDLHKPGADFDQWAVQVWVKFREHEALSLLDAHRQSGGERAVSTIFYLMALQSLSRAPFRVVDEINQGMDPRNERMVHERMVDIACGADGDASSSSSSQYFLITPKLLSGLKYARGMVVHCIASGEMMPEDCRKLDFGQLVARARELRAPLEARAASSSTEEARTRVAVA